MSRRKVDDIDVCHGMLHDAYCASLAPIELQSCLTQVDDKSGELVQLVQQMRCATMGLEAAVKPWADSLGPADLGRDAALTLKTQTRTPQQEGAQ